jgi:hypothetical protein
MIGGNFANTGFFGVPPVGAALLVLGSAGHGSHGFGGIPESIGAGGAALQRLNISWRSHSW